jgi:DNA-binding NtrC family response regulator
MRIFIVDDEQLALTSVRRILKYRGLMDVEICDNGKDAIRQIREKEFDIVLLDILMPEVDGLQVLEASKPYSPLTEFIIITAVEDIDTSVKAIRLGAYDYLVKPLEPKRLILSIERAYERKSLRTGVGVSGSNREVTEMPAAFSHIITRSPRMIELLNYAQVIARSGNPILITGESGTGKELLAQGVHRAGPGPERPFIPVNVTSVPETLFESQFFGHIKGTFTGAERDHTGYFEQADAGSLFLDEIGELPKNLQVKLLRALEEKSITRIGETVPKPVDVQIISSTNKDLVNACRTGKFRLDLFYRLNSAHIHLPPLRDRLQDIPLLAEHFLKLACLRHKRDIRGFSPEALVELTQMDYPGNIRELAQMVERVVMLSDAPYILPEHLGKKRPVAETYSRTLCSLKENDEAQVAFVLYHTRGDRKKAAQILGVSVRQVQRKVAKMKENPRWQTLLD